MGIPTDITVRLVIDTVALSIMNTFFQTFADSSFAFLCGGVKRCTIAGQSYFFERDKFLIGRRLKEKGVKNFPESQAGHHIRRGIIFKLPKQTFDSNFFNRSSFYFFAFWFLRLFFGWTDGVREIFIIRQPKASVKVIEGTNAGSISVRKTGNDCM